MPAVRRQRAVTFRRPVACASAKAVEALEPCQLAAPKHKATATRKQSCQVADAVVSSESDGPDDSGSQSSGKSFLPPCAKRARYDPSGSTKFAIQFMPCLVGGRLKDPLCLPTRQFAKVSGEAIAMVRFAAKESWVNQSVAGRVIVKASLPAAQKQVMEKIRAAVVEARVARGTADVAKEKEVVDTAAKGRLALGLDDSSSEDEVIGSECLPSGSPQLFGAASSCAAKRPAKHDPKLVHDVMIDGRSLSVAYCERKCWVECSADAIETVSTLMSVALKPPSVQRAQSWAATRDKGPMPEEVAGRVLWNEAKSTWSVAYKAHESGKRMFYYAGLRVQRKDRCGAPVSEAQYLQDFRSKMQLAKSKWNELDKSGLDRFVL